MSKPSSQNKTVPKSQTPAKYIQTLAKQEQEQAKTLLKIFKETTAMNPVMWGSMFGFGSYHYKYDSGREGDFLATGFAIRKSGPTIYIMPGYQNYEKILKDIGPHKLGKSCLYLKNLDELNVRVLQKLIKTGLKDLNKKYPVQGS